MWCEMATQLKFFVSAVIPKDVFLLFSPHHFRRMEHNMVPHPGEALAHLYGADRKRGLGGKPRRGYIRNS